MTSTVSAVTSLRRNVLRNALVGRLNNIDLMTIASDPDGDPLRVNSLTINFPPSYTVTLTRVNGPSGRTTINTPGSQIVILDLSRLTQFTYRAVSGVGVGTIDYVVSDGKAERTGTLTFNAKLPF
jgi:hypothetical protein